MNDEKRKQMSEELKAERKLEEELRRGWGNASSLSFVYHPDECGKRTKPLPRLD